MFGPGLAAGLNAGMRDIEDRRRQEMLDAERQEDRGMRREQFDMQKEQYGLQMAEMERERDMRKQRGLLAQGAVEHQPYTGGDVNDPEFGIEAQADMGGMGNGLGLLSGLKTNEKQLNTGKYLSDMERHYAEAGDVEQAMKMRQAAEGIRKEGGVEAVKRLIAGDIQGAERAWNTTGSERIQPGSIKVDGDNVSWVNSQGKQVEMPLPALMDLVGIKRPESPKPMTVARGGALVDHQGNELYRNPYEQGGGAGGRRGGAMKPPTMSEMRQHYLLDAGLSEERIMIAAQQEGGLERLIEEIGEAGRFGEWSANNYGIDVYSGDYIDGWVSPLQRQQQPEADPSEIQAQAMAAIERGADPGAVVARLRENGMGDVADRIQQGAQQPQPQPPARQPGLLEQYGGRMSNPVDGAPKAPQLAGSPGNTPHRQRQQKDVQDKFTQLSSEGLLDKPSPELFAWIEANIDSLTGRQKQQAQQYLNRNRSVLQYQGREDSSFNMNPTLRN